MRGFVRDRCLNIQKHFVYKSKTLGTVHIATEPCVAIIKVCHKITFPVSLLTNVSISFENSSAGDISPIKRNFNFNNSKQSEFFSSAFSTIDNFLKTVER